MIIQKVCSWLLYRCLRWKADVSVEMSGKYIVCLAPHTSNWDFIIGQLYCRAAGLRINFLMKSEWFFWPLGPLFRRLGGIPVQRNKHTSMTDTLAEVASCEPDFRLCITPEGTRKRNADWKRGFYFIALKAGLPVKLFGMDYRRRLIQCTQEIRPSGDVEAELPRIKQYFAQFTGKHPELFAY